MFKNFFKSKDGSMAVETDENTAMDSEGRLLIKMGENLFTDTETGETHFFMSDGQNTDKPF